MREALGGLVKGHHKVPVLAITDLQGPAVDREYLGSG